MKIRLLAGFPGASLAGHGLAELRARPDPGSGGPSDALGRLALLAVGGLQDLGLDRIALQTEFGERLSFQHLPAACDCCVAAPIVAVTLGRLLRSGPFAHLLVLADARMHLEGLERALSRQAGVIQRRGLMTDEQRVLLREPTRAGHQAALDLVAWAGDGMTFVGQA